MRAARETKLLIRARPASPPRFAWAARRSSEATLSTGFGEGQLAPAPASKIFFSTLRGAVFSPDQRARDPRPGRGRARRIRPSAP
jgi:hypothetical protein